MIRRLPPVDPREPAIVNPQLARLVERARPRSAPELHVTPEQVHDGWRRRHHRRIMTATASVMAAAAASWLFTVGPSVLGGAVETDASMAVDQHPAADRDGKVVPRSVHRIVRTEPVDNVATQATTNENEPESVAAPVLTEDKGNQAHQPADEGALEDAARRPQAKRLGPSALARRADQYLAAGDREGAIRTWTALVSRYPRAPVVRGALLDLGRALKASGRHAEARCAYRMFLDRWPHSQLRTEVERALVELGDGSCRGLAPR